jgi:ferredoxin
MKKEESKISKIKDRVAKLLEKDVSVFIAYERMPFELKDRLTIISSPKEVDKISVSPFMVGSPARMLLEIGGIDDGKIGIIARACDTRAIKQLIKEGKIKRERVYIMGITCGGMVNTRKLRSPRFENGRLYDHDREVHMKDVLYDTCSRCEDPLPVLYDEVFDVFDVFEGVSKADESTEEIEGDREKRWSYWMGEMEKCIRCYACRSACPMCYCTECLVDPINLAVSPFTSAEEKASYPRFLGKTISAEDNLFYHIIRVLHHAGRCADCGECERACPMDIPIRELERKMREVVRDVFGYDDDEIPFLAKLDMIPEGR